MENVKKLMDENNSLAREALETANSANKNSKIAMNMASANTASINELHQTVNNLKLKVSAAEQTNIDAANDADGTSEKIKELEQRMK